MTCRDERAQVPENLMGRVSFGGDGRQPEGQFSPEVPFRHGDSRAGSER
jgi:hypothetical protein